MGTCDFFLYCTFVFIYLCQERMTLLPWYMDRGLGRNNKHGWFILQRLDYILYFSSVGRAAECNVTFARFLLRVSYSHFAHYVNRLMGGS